MKTILVATDLGARSDRAVSRAAHIAAAVGAELLVLHVVDDDVPPAILQARTEQAEAVLADMIAESTLLKGCSAEVIVEAGHVERLLPEVARATGADLLVLGGHRNRGLGEILGPPTLTRLLRGTDLPVLVALGRPEEPYKAATVGFDFSDAGMVATRLALQVAPEADVTLLHAWQDICTGAPYAFEMGGVVPKDVLEGLKSKLSRAAAELSPPEERPLACEVQVGPPGHLLRQRGQTGKADLIAVGRHARTGLARLILGATAEDISLLSSCDVLIAPPE